MNPPAFLAKRFVAGTQPQDAVAAGQKLGERGIKATFDLLGEDVLDRDAARRLTQAIQGLLRLIPQTLERNVSIKLSMTGLHIDRDFCVEQTAQILDTAREVKGFVRIDMEGSQHTEATLAVFHELRKRYDNVGIVLQAYLHRTERDVLQALERGDRVRLCKGAYKEPASVALQKMDDVRANFRKLAHLLLEKGTYPALATHDESLVKDVLGHAAQHGIGPERYEFQMLYGLRPRRWDELVKAGHNLRIYVPYGTHWFPYFYRRLRERKENILFVLKGLFD